MFVIFPLSRLLTFAAAVGIAFAWSHAASAYTLQLAYGFCSTGGAACTDGSSPKRQLTIDSAGNLYGTTALGGAHQKGVAFKLTANAGGAGYTYHVLHNFCARANCADGDTPHSNLIVDAQGRLYGTTEFGGKHGLGTVFQLSHSANGWSETVIHNFCATSQCTDGTTPQTGLSYKGQDLGAPWDGASPLFGTALGGAYNHGIDFKLALSGSQWNFQAIHNFKESNGPNELTVDSSGNIFGTAIGGGKYGGGELYRLAHDTWTATVLHNFCKLPNCEDGKNPTGRMAVDSAGNLFGSTVSGSVYDDGVVFERLASNGVMATPLFLLRLRRRRRGTA